MRKKIHFIGIGGLSMRALAEISFLQKNDVTGTDKIIPENIQYGIRCFLENNRSQVPEGTDLIVFNNIIPDNHPEILYAKERNIPIIPRAFYLNEITKDRFKFLITGTDGKTSTSYYIHQLAEMLNIDPFTLIGVDLDNDKCYKVGSGPYIVEHNEGDLPNCIDDADIMIFTTFDGKDHIWNFNNSYDLFYTLYRKLFLKAKKVICNIDCENIINLIGNYNNLITFGQNKNAEFCILNIEESLEELNFSFKYSDNIYQVKTNLCGEFSAYNVMAAIISIYQIYPNLENIIEKCLFLKHAKSRFEVVYKDDVKTIFSSLHGSGDSLAKVVKSLSKYKKPISIIVNFNETRGEVFFDEFYNVLKNYRFACFKGSYIAKHTSEAYLIETQEDFNRFLDTTEGICIIAHAKYCFHNYLKNYYKDFKSCLG